MNRPTYLKTVGRVIALTSLLGILLFSPQAATASPVNLFNPAATASYYVDSKNGSDSNPGTSPDEPWQTLDKVNAYHFAPGNVIYFKRGSVFRGGLYIRDSGTAAQPIRFTAYGNGYKPAFMNPGSLTNLTSAITIRGDYIILENLTARFAKLAGVYIYEGADHNIVRKMNITAVGEGVKVNGQFNKITWNSIHDLRMVRNTPGGDDDYGAVGVWLFNGHNEVAFNQLVNCKASSYDYGEDGGSVEFWASSGVEVNGNYVHHNYSRGNKGFSEFGGRGGTIFDTRIAYNVIVDNDRPLGFHLSGGFAANIRNVRFENNTVVDLRDDGNPSTWTVWTAFIFGGGVPSPETLLVRNNIFYLADYQKMANESSFIHENNIYYFTNPSTKLGFTLNPSEKITDPLLVDVTNGDFHLTSGSPAIDAGLNLNYFRDFDRVRVPAGSGPDIGAYEYR